MRGFRGSRAAQSFNSRSERHYQRKTERESFLRMVEQRQQPKAQPQLPEWLKGLEQPQNVVPITAAKKRVTAKPVKSKGLVSKAKSSGRTAAIKRK